MATNLNIDGLFTRVSSLETTSNNVYPTLAASDGASKVGFKQVGSTFNQTVERKLKDNVSVKDFGAIGDGTTIDSTAIQAALDSGAKSVYLPPGTYLLDFDLSVPAGVEFYGAGNSSILRMVGRDTHSRNCILFTKYNGVNISASPAMVVLIGSNSSAHDFMCDGNGQNNYDFTGGVKTYVDEVAKYGYHGVRIGRLTNRAPTDPKTFIENCDVYNVTVKLTAWGAFTIAGVGYRQDTSNSVSGDEDLIGARYCSIRDCKSINTFSNNIATFSTRDSSITGCRVVNNVHKGIAVYVRCRDILIEGNEFIYDETTDVSWKDSATVDNYRERELDTRSDAIAVGHSDYNTLISNISVIGNKLRGNGKIRNGINIHSNTKNVSVIGNHVTGFISPLAVGVCSNLTVTGNTFSASNYTTVSLTPGKLYIGADVQFTARSIETTKTAPASYGILSFTGNNLLGGGVNNIRGNDWSVWNALDIGLQAHFTGNTYNIAALVALDVNPAKSIMINSAPTSLNASAMHFENEKYVLVGNESTGATVFDSNVLWSFVWPYGLRFSFTPVPIGSTTSGVATTIAATGIYIVNRGCVTFSMETGWSAHTGTGNIRVTGLPIPSRSTVNGGVATSLGCHFSSLTFTGQVEAVLLNSATTIDLYGLVTNSGLTAVAMDTSVNILRVSGTYFT